MEIGTRSVLAGAHCFFIHPWFVAAGWWKLYGVPLDPRLWVAFFVHDIGYLGKPNMDGPEGEDHVYFGAGLMGVLFGDEWYRLCVYHSRYHARKHDQPPSRLCMADKLAIALTPWWLYLPMVRFTGEILEYKSVQKHQDEHGEWYGDTWSEDRKWFRSLQDRMRAWVEENANRTERSPDQSPDHQGAET